MIQISEYVRLVEEQWGSRVVGLGRLFTQGNRFDEWRLPTPIASWLWTRFAASSAGSGLSFESSGSESPTNAAAATECGGRADTWVRTLRLKVHRGSMYSHDSNATFSRVLSRVVAIPMRRKQTQFFRNGIGGAGQRRVINGSGVPCELCRASYSIE